MRHGYSRLLAANRLFGRLGDRVCRTSHHDACKPLLHLHMQMFGHLSKSDLFAFSQGTLLISTRIHVCVLWYLHISSPTSAFLLCGCKIWEEQVCFFPSRLLNVSHTLAWTQPTASYISSKKNLVASHAPTLYPVLVPWIAGSVLAISRSSRFWDTRGLWEAVVSRLQSCLFLPWLWNVGCV